MAPTSAPKVTSESAQPSPPGLVLPAASPSSLALCPLSPPVLRGDYICVCVSFPGRLSPCKGEDFYLFSIAVVIKCIRLLASLPS